MHHCTICTFVVVCVISFCNGQTSPNSNGDDPFPPYAKVNFCPLKYKEKCARPQPNQTAPSPGDPGWCYLTLYCNVNDKLCHRFRDTKESKKCMYNHECRPYLFCKRSQEQNITRSPGECVRWLTEGQSCHIEDGSASGCKQGLVCTATAKGQSGACAQKWVEDIGAAVEVQAQCKPWLNLDRKNGSCREPIPAENCASHFQLPFLHPPRPRSGKKQLSFYENCGGICKRVLGTESCSTHVREWDRYVSVGTMDARKLSNAEFRLLECLYTHGLAGYYWGTWSWSTKQIAFAIIAAVLCVVFIVCLALALKAKNEQF